MSVEIAAGLMANEEPIGTAEDAMRMLTIYKEGGGGIHVEAFRPASDEEAYHAFNWETPLNAQTSVDYLAHRARSLPGLQEIACTLITQGNPMEDAKERLFNRKSIITVGPELMLIRLQFDNGPVLVWDKLFWTKFGIATYGLKLNEHLNTLVSQTATTEAQEIVSTNRQLIADILGKFGEVPFGTSILEQ
jgi:hypothetical protein